MIASNGYQENATRCVRLAEGTNDFVFSFGFMKMAEAWLDLAERRAPSQVKMAGSPSATSSPNRRANRRRRRKAG
jgi:hypothetical protein